MSVKATEKTVFTLDVHLTPADDDATVILTRQKDDGIQTLGNLIVYKKGEVIFSCDTLELPWRNNKHGMSCVPIGAYNLKRYSSDKHKDVYALPGVPDREYILIHPGNYYTDIEGCILVGKDYEDINGDGTLDILKSAETLNKLKEALEYDEVPIIIQNS